MAAVKKITMTQISKDFALKTKDIIDLLKTHGLEKKSGATLSEAEFSFFLDALTADNQIENLDDYLTGKARILCKPKPEYYETIKCIYLTIINGFTLLSRIYPEHVELVLD